MQAAPIVLGLVLLAAGRAPASPATLEYEVKAAFVYNFAKFVEWPAAAFPDPAAPVTICIVGADPFGAVLDDTVKGEQLEQHPLAVARYPDAPPPGACHLLFVSASEQRRYPALLSGVDGRRTLTIGDTISFLDAGGYFAFFLDNGRVRIAVNSDLAGTSGLKVSSKLLRVAMPHKPARVEGSR
jgi:hypothetical protein